MSSEAFSAVLPALASALTRRGFAALTPIQAAAIDPALKLDLLARVAAVKLEGGDRSLFEFSQAPPPKAPDVKIVPGPVKPVKPEPPPPQPPPPPPEPRRESPPP